MNIGVIVSGWSKAMGIIGISENEQRISIERMELCGTCEYSKSSKFLEFLSTGPENIEGLFCTKCKCPCHQKSLTTDTCPLGKWDKIK